MREWEGLILSHIKNMRFYLVFLNVNIYIFNTTIVMIDDKKIEAAKEEIYEDRFLLNGEEIVFNNDEKEEMFYKEDIKEAIGLGAKWGINELLKDMFHPASEVPQIGRGRILAYSRDCGYRNLYNLYDMMYKTDCGTYQEMWELEVKAYYLDGWIYADELFDLIIKGGECK